ncbi:restriction endonuclease subunit S [Agathobacter rectalis]|uniref:restriction endonuclease subunit S n=1 Tax=Agathobacter rectalis TaxID=39491 RepID=UPI0027D1F27D|nr:restriction endonuclease subunit S [Agathobacter rectalis]MCG4814732.1 restriction endonuclease subunit S [Agathobacter rectalis]
MENPKIRFKGFTKDWEQRKLGATNTFFTDGNYGEAYPKSSDMTDSGSGVPFLTGGNLKDGKLSLDGASYITPEKHSKLTSGHLLEDDIVIAVRGSLGALGYVNTDNSGWNINSQLAILRTDKSELYGKFLIQYLLSWTGQNELLKRQTGSALKQLPIGAIKDVEVPITSIAEQEKIGEYLDSVDHLITLHQRKCEQTKKLKKYMLQKMFPQNGAKVPEIRFDGFTYDWEQRKLGDVIDDMYNGQTPSRNKSEYWNGTIKWLSSGELNRGTVYDSIETITEEGQKAANLKIVPKGTFVMAITGLEAAGTRGNCALLGFDTTLNQSCMALFPKQEMLTSEFLFQWYRKVGEEYGINYTQGTKQQSYNAELIKILPISLPSVVEQREISSYLSHLDHLITLHQRKCDELKKMKKYMLQNMFI